MSYNHNKVFENGSKVCGLAHHPELHSEFKKSPGYMRPYLRKPQKVLGLEENREGTDLDYEN